MILVKHKTWRERERKTKIAYLEKRTSFATCLITETVLLTSSVVSLRLTDIRILKKAEIDAH